MDNKVNFLILTDINVSNVHLMLARILNDFSSLNVKFLNARNPRSFFDQSSWYDKAEEIYDLSYSLKSKSLVSKIFKLFSIINKSDIVLCTGVVANLVFLLKKPYIYFCTGSDLDQYTKYGCNIFELHNSITSLFKKLQRPLKKFLYFTAIKKAETTIITSYQYEDLKRIGYKKLGFFPHPLEKEYLDIKLKDREIYSNNIKEEFGCNWIFFSSTRHEWSEYLVNENDYKGNDVIIKAFYFCYKMGLKGGKLFLIEKGGDVNKSKELIRDLGIEANVIWLKPMNRKRLYEFYCGADVCFDQFSKGCLALCAVEAMSCGAPTITYIGPVNTEVPFYKELPPVFNCKEPEKISEYIMLLFNDEILRKRIEKESYEWVRRNCSYEKIVEAFNSMVNTLLMND